MEFFLRQFKAKTENESFLRQLNSFRIFHEINFFGSISQIFALYLETIEYKNCCVKRT